MFRLILYIAWREIRVLRNVGDFGVSVLWAIRAALERDEILNRSKQNKLHSDTLWFKSSVSIITEGDGPIGDLRRREKKRQTRVRKRNAVLTFAIFQLSRGG